MRRLCSVLGWAIVLGSSTACSMGTNSTEIVVEHTSEPVPTVAPGVVEPNVPPACRRLRPLLTTVYCGDLGWAKYDDDVFVVHGQSIEHFDQVGRRVAAYALAEENQLFQIAAGRHRFHFSRILTIVQDSPATYALVAFGTQVPGPTRLMRFDGRQLAMDDRLDRRLGVQGAWSLEVGGIAVAVRPWLPDRSEPDGEVEIRVLGTGQIASLGGLYRQPTCKRRSLAVVHIARGSESQLHAQIRCGEEFWAGSWSDSSRVGAFVRVRTAPSSPTVRGAVTGTASQGTYEGRWNRCRVPAPWGGAALSVEFAPTTRSGAEFVFACEPPTDDEQRPPARGAVFQVVAG